MATAETARGAAVLASHPLPAGEVPGVRGHLPRGEAPRGLAAGGDTHYDITRTLYVADTGNGTIRSVDLEGERVETIAGTGEQGLGMPEAGPAREVDLRSPWDLAIHGEHLYIAMAGTHQIWWLHLEHSG
jgi:hypothetical protein